MVPTRAPVADSGRCHFWPIDFAAVPRPAQSWALYPDYKWIVNTSQIAVPTIFARSQSNNERNHTGTTELKASKRSWLTSNYHVIKCCKEQHIYVFPLYIKVCSVGHHYNKWWWRQSFSISRRKCVSRLRLKQSPAYACVMFHLVTAQIHADAITTHGGFVISYHVEETIDQLRCRLRNQKWSEWRTWPWSATNHQSSVKHPFSASSNDLSFFSATQMHHILCILTVQNQITGYHWNSALWFREFKSLWKKL